MKDTHEFILDNNEILALKKLFNIEIDNIFSPGIILKKDNLLLTQSLSINIERNKKWLNISSLIYPSKICNCYKIITKIDENPLNISYENECYSYPFSSIEIFSKVKSISLLRFKEEWEREIFITDIGFVLMFENGKELTVITESNSTEFIKISWDNFFDLSEYELVQLH